jgi:hypothetical protein
MLWVAKTRNLVLRKSERDRANRDLLSGGEKHGRKEGKYKAGKEYRKASNTMREEDSKEIIPAYFYVIL